MQITEHRLELHNLLAIEHHIHAKHAMRRRMMRPHRDFEQLAAVLSVRRNLRQDLVIVRGLF